MNTNLFANPQIFQAYNNDPSNAYAQALMQQGASTAPVRSPLEGLARALQGGVGGFFASRTKDRYQQQDEKYRQGLAAALQGGDVLKALQASEDPMLQQMALSARVEQATKAPTEKFTPLTPEQEVQFGLDPSGVYQRGDLSGKIDTLTTPAAPRKVGDTRDILRGATKVYQEWDGDKWSDIGSGPAYAPPAPKDTWKTVTDADGKPLYQESSTGERKAIPGQEGLFKQENTLRDEYNTLTKDFRVVQDAYNKIQKTSDTGAGDMSLLYSYVKLLDPGSVVRESEFATAAASGSYGERIQGLVQRVMTGERLPASLRDEFKKEATGIYDAQKLGYENAGKQYTDLANRAKVDPANVVVPYATQPMAPPRPPGPAPVLRYNPNTMKMEPVL